MKQISVVVSSYKLDPFYLQRFLHFNFETFRRLDVDLYVVSDLPPIDNRYISIESPFFKVFSITRSSNVGIRQALRYGSDIIIKTDIDCVLTENFIEYCKNNNACFRHFECKVEDDKVIPLKMNPRTMGTISMKSEDWLKSGGFNERMSGYGSDDYAIFVNAQEAGVKIKLVRRPKCLHISHEKHNLNSINPVNRRENRKVMNEKQPNFLI